MAEIEWKTYNEEELQTPSHEERIEALEKALLDIILGGIDNG